MGLKTWINGNTGGVVKGVIDGNFATLGKYLSRNILTLTSSQRGGLTSDYKSEGLLSYDPNEDTWYQYRDGKWQKKTSNGSSTSNLSKYILEFTSDDWAENVETTVNEIVINFATHLVSDPVVQLYIITDGVDIPVVGGFEIDSEYNVTLSSDLKFNGKVVIT